MGFDWSACDWVFVEDRVRYARVRRHRWVFLFRGVWGKEGRLKVMWSSYGWRLKEGEKKLA